MSALPYKLLHLILFLLLQTAIKSEEIDENKFFFQLYPSWNLDSPNFFYAQTWENLLVINSTEGEYCNITEKKVVNEYYYKNISSASTIDDIYLAKTCFGPNKLIEIVYKNKESYSYKKSNFENIKFCYSTKINNPNINLEHPEKKVILTYWTEVKNGINREKYSHKSIIFYPNSKTFSEELTLNSSSNFVVNIYYPEKCVTFRDTDIFCGIHYSPAESDESHLVGNNYVIETDKIILDAVYSKGSSVKLVGSNTKLSSTSFQRPIALGKITNISLDVQDIYITEYHNSEGKGKTLLMYSNYRKSLHTSFIPFYESSSTVYGLNIEDNYVHQNLFNYLVPNEDELIILYISKEAQMSLLLTRFNVSDSRTKKLTSFKQVAFNSYIRTDICQKPKYLQSIYINSYINYEKEDKSIISLNPQIHYNKFHKDIGVLISCEQDNKIIYESKKIELPQCLNILDKLNGNNNHILKYSAEQKEVIFDLYNDPNLISLRNVTIYFQTSLIFSIYIQIQLKVEGEKIYRDAMYNLEYNKITHIKFLKKINLPIGKSFSLPYRLKQKLKETKDIVSYLQSDVCNLEFSSYNNEEEQCRVEFCSVCKDSSHCYKCNEDIIGITKDTIKTSDTYEKCVCNEYIGFKKIPDEKFKMCVCKDNYSFYKNKKYCMPNEDLQNGPYYKNDTDNLTGIDIYDECYSSCKKCSRSAMSLDEQYCTECKYGYILIGINCIKRELDFSTTSPNIYPLITNNIYNTPTFPTSFPNDQEEKNITYENCFSNRKVWFQLGENIFYYIKIDNCILVYDGDELFFISSKIKCSILSDNFDIKFLSICLNHSEIEYQYDYLHFINNEDIKEYNPESNNMTIYKKIKEKNMTFYLVNYKADNKDNNLSKIYFDQNGVMDLLAFKVDIKRSDTISTQVEYQFYNPDPEHIDEVIDITQHLSQRNKRRLQKEDQDNAIFLDLPISWKQGQLNKINELYNKNISAFNSSSEFYLDVCNKYTTPDNGDIYLQNRKEEYYPDEKFCEENCQFFDYNYNTAKITCKCTPKKNTDNYDKVTFKYNDKDEKFKKKFTSPNLKSMGCGSVVSKTLEKNSGFFLTLILLIIFVVLFIKRMFDFYPIEEKDPVYKEFLKLKDIIVNKKDNNISLDKNQGKVNKSEKIETKKIFIEDINEKGEENLIPFSNSKDESDKKPKIKIISSGEDSDSKIKKSEVKSDQGIASDKLSDSNNFNSNPKKEENELNNNESNDNENKNEDDNNNNVEINNENQFQDQNNKKENDLKDNKNDNEEDNINENLNINEEKEKKPENNLIDENNNNTEKDKSEQDSNLNDNNNELISKDGEEEDKKEDEKKDDNNDNKNENLKMSLSQSLNKNLKNSHNKHILNININKAKNTNNNKINESNLGKVVNDYNKDDDISSTNSKISEGKESLIDDSSKLNENDNIKFSDLVGESYINEKANNNNEEKSKNNNEGNNELDSVVLEINDNPGESSNTEVKSGTFISKSDKDNNNKRRTKKIKDNNKSSHISNPPTKENHSNDVDNYLKINENIRNNLTSSRRPLKLSENKLEEYYDNDYLLNQANFCELMKNKENNCGDKRNIFEMLKSVIKHNSTIIYIFSDKHKDEIFTKISIFILCLSFYICLNVFLVFNMSMVQLYIHFLFGYFSLNIFIPCFVSIPVILIKKYISQKDLLYYLLNLSKQKINKNIKKTVRSLSNNRKSIKLDVNFQIENFDDIIQLQYVEYIKPATIIYGIFGIIFLIFNCVLVTSFCGIYPNSIGNLVLNTIVSIIGACFLTIIFYLIGVILRYFSLKNKNELMYNISRFFNPLQLTCKDLQNMLFKKKDEKDNEQLNEEGNLKEKPKDIEEDEDKKENN